MECAQINVTGGSGSKNPATVSFPGAYKGTDPGTSNAAQSPISTSSFLNLWFSGVKINIYQNLANYTIPGKSSFIAKCGANCLHVVLPPDRTVRIHLLS